MLMDAPIFRPKTCICGDEDYWPEELPDWLFCVAVRRYPTQRERQRNPSLPQYIQHIIFMHIRARAAYDVAKASVGASQELDPAHRISKSTAQTELGMLEEDVFVYPGGDHMVFERKREAVVVKKA